MNVVGLNNNDFQIGRARRYTKQAGLENQVSFVKGDFMKLSEQFGENSFDAVYAIEATVHAPTFEGVYGEIMKVLKPGGVVSSCTFCCPVASCSCFVVWRVRVVHDGQVGPLDPRAQGGRARD